MGAGLVTNRLDGHYGGLAGVASWLGVGGGVGVCNQQALVWLDIAASL